MPFKPPHRCACGHLIPAGSECPCQIKRAFERRYRHDRRRPSARERGYDSTWEKDRVEFLRLNPICRRCSNPATVVDHIVPHRGNPVLFRNRANWQPLCAPCHNGAKQSLERTS